jgi:hypothetical protein
MYKPYVSTENSNKKSRDNSKLEVKKEIDLLEEFDRVKVEPLNFVRKTLLDYDECLSYL